MFLFATAFQKELVTKTVTFTMKHGNETVGDIKLGLFGEVVPKTVENFFQIAKNDPAETKQAYLNTIFHRIIPNFMIQGGDFERRDGTGGYSIYGRKFDDENFKLKLKPYCLAMANAGPNTNGAQFFITAVDTPWLNGHHVVFGTVLEGKEVVDKLENVKRNARDKPLEDVVIAGVSTDDSFEPFEVDY